MAEVRSSLVAGGWLVTLPLAGVAAARILDWDRHPFLSMANAGTPFVYLPAWGAAAVGAAFRRPALATVAGAVGAAHLAWTAPELRRARPVPPEARTATRLRVVTSNIRFPSRDSTPLGREFTQLAPDVLLLQELSPRHERMIKATGAFDPFPYSYVDARPGSFGAGIWSRYPLRQAETWEPGGLAMVRGTIDVDGTPVRIFNIHIKAPMRGRWIPVWKNQYRDIAAAVNAEPTPAIVAGDFNSTHGHAPFRQLLAGTGLRDAHVDAGRGLATTWPRGGRIMPPLFRLDHVLLSDGLAVLEVREGRGTGSDHRPVIADVAVLPSPE